MADIAPALLGVVVAAAVVAPWVGGGWLLVLDWVHGPHSALPPGSGVLSGLQPSLPVASLLQAIGGLVGFALIAWMTVAVSIVVAAHSIGRLVPGGTVARLAAAALYTTNPFVFERIGAGQIYVLLGYALLPVVVRSLVGSEHRAGWRRWSPAVWIAVDAGISIHFLWISGVVIAGVVLYRHRLRTVAWGAGISLLSVLLTSYVLVPSLLQHQTVSAGGSDLAAYQTAGDPRLGLFGNVLGLYGFWRQGVVLPKDHFSGWPALMAAVLVVCAAGAWSTRRRDDRRPMVAIVTCSGVIGYFLALGSQGPTGWLFRLLYFHLPGFAVMREPEKFSSLLALGYAVTFGLGAEAITASVVAWRRALAALAALALPIAYSFTLFDGLGGQVATSRYPASWYTANRVMGSGPGKILFLPLHEYLAFPFTHGEVIANPGAQVFERPVLVGGEVGAGPLLTDSLSPENAYLAAIVADGTNIHELGHLVAQLGVRYIVVATGADSYNYGWVAKQRDLTEVYAGAGLAVYRNPLALPEGARLSSKLILPSTACYLQIAQTADLVGTAVFVRPGAGGCALPPGFVAGPPILDVRRGSSVSYRAETGPAGTVALPEDAVNAWGGAQGNGHALADGVVGLPAGSGPATVTLTHWEASIAADALSFGLFAILTTGVLTTSRRARSTLTPTTP